MKFLKVITYPFAWVINLTWTDHGFYEFNSFWRYWVYPEYITKLSYESYFDLITLYDGSYQLKKEVQSYGGIIGYEHLNKTESDMLILFKDKKSQDRFSSVVLSYKSEMATQEQLLDMGQFTDIKNFVFRHISGTNESAIFKVLFKYPIHAAKFNELMRFHAVEISQADFEKLFNTYSRSHNMYDPTSFGAIGKRPAGDRYRFIFDTEDRKNWFILNYL